MIRSIRGFYRDICWILAWSRYASQTGTKKGWRS